LTLQAAAAFAPQLVFKNSIKSSRKFKSTDIGCYPQSLCNNSPSCWITKPTFAFDLTKPPAAFARQSEQVTACHPTDNAKNNVTQETKVPVFHHCSGQPTSHSADCEKNNQPVMSIVPPQFYR